MSAATLPESDSHGSAPSGEDAFAASVKLTPRGDRCEKCHAPLAGKSSSVCKKCGWYAMAGVYVDIDRSWEAEPEDRPAAANSGIVLHRTDVAPGRGVSATLQALQPAQRRTVIGSQDVRVEMVEHLLSAFTGMRIDNCRVHLTGPEPPCGDGSALHFVEAIDRGVREILHEARNRAAAILSENRPLVETLRDQLLEHKIIDSKTLAGLKVNDSR